MCIYRVDRHSNHWNVPLYLVGLFSICLYDIWREYAYVLDIVFCFNTIVFYLQTDQV